MLEYSGVELDGGSASPVRDLGLRVDGDGLTTSGLPGAGSRTVRWAELSAPRCGAPSAQLDGRRAVTISGEVGGRLLRWLVPADQLRATDAMTLDRALARLPVVGAALTGGAPSVTPFGASAPAPADTLLGPPPTSAPWDAEPPTLANFVPPPPVAATAAPATWPAPACAPPGYAPPGYGPPGYGPPGYGGAPYGPAPYVGPAYGSPPGWGDAPGWGAPPPWHPGPPVRVKRSDVRPKRSTFIIVLCALALAVAAAIVIPLVFNSSPAPQQGRSVVGGDQEVARQINLAQSDVPSGWVAEAAGQSPLSGLLSTSSGSSSSLTPAERSQIDQIDATYEQCMGVSAANDRIFGNAGATPTADASSPAFAGPSGSTHIETGTNVVLFRSPAAVAADQAQTSEPQFPTCFGAAFAALLSLGGSSSGSTAQVGTPQVTTLSLPSHAGVATVGVSVTLPVSTATVSTSTQIGVVLVSAGRSEATIYTFASPGPFPASLTSSLTATMQRKLVAESAGTGT